MQKQDFPSCIVRNCTVVTLHDRELQAALLLRCNMKVDCSLYWTLITTISCCCLFLNRQPRQHEWATERKTHRVNTEQRQTDDILGDNPLAWRLFARNHCPSAHTLLLIFCVVLIYVYVYFQVRFEVRGVHNLAKLRCLYVYIYWSSIRRARSL